MYKREFVRVYECDMCGQKVALLPKREGNGPLTSYVFPGGWTGTYRKGGVCLCPRCAKAYKMALDRLAEKEN